MADDFPPRGRPWRESRRELIAFNAWLRINRIDQPPFCVDPECSARGLAHFDSGVVGRRRLYPRKRRGPGRFSQRDT